MTNYQKLHAELCELTEGIEHPVANLANAAALLYEVLPDVNWAGFYLLRGERLVLGPFQGRPACIEIPVGKGVCGTSVARACTQVVPDVHQFPGHIACDGASRSEIVIPLWQAGRIVGVLDIDSPIGDRFDKSDREGLEQFASALSERVAWELLP